MVDWKKVKRIILLFVGEQARIHQKRWEKLETKDYFSQESLVNWLQLAKELGEQNNSKIADLLSDQHSRLNEIERLKKELEEEIQKEEEEKIVDLRKKLIIENNILSLARQIFEKDIKINKLLHENQFIINELKDLQEESFFEDSCYVISLDESIVGELKTILISWNEEIDNLKGELLRPINDYLDATNAEKDLKEKLWGVLKNADIRQKLMDLKQQVDYLWQNFKEKEKKQEIIKIKTRIEGRIKVGVPLSDEKIIRYLELTLANTSEEEGWIRKDWWVKCGLIWKEGTNFSLETVKSQCQISLKHKRKREERKRTLNLEAKIEVKKSSM